MFGLVETAHAATEATASASGFSTLGLDWRLFLGQLFNFLVIFFVLWKFVIKPLSAVMQKRQKIVEGSLANAEVLEKKMVGLQAEYDRTIAEALKEANAVLEKAHQQAEVKAQKLMTQAKNEVAKVIAEGRQTLQTEREAMVLQAKKDVVNAVVASTEKILQGVVDDTVDQAWLKAQLKKVG